MARRRRLARGVDRVRLVDFSPTAGVVPDMITTCCDHMADDAQFVFCDLNRQFPFECSMCAAFVTDQDPTPDRERVWTLRVVGPAEAQATAECAEPGSGESEC